MTEFLSPQVVVVEIRRTVAVVKRISPNTSIMLGSAERGPNRRYVKVTSPEDFVAIYGNDDGGPLAQSVFGFFDNGGDQLFISRCEHYTDITDIATLTCEAASTDLLTESSVDTPASKTTSDGPWDFSVANGVAQPPTLSVGIGGNPDDDLVIACTASVLTAAGDFVGAATIATTAIFRVEGVEIVYTTPNPAPTTKEALALDIAAQVPGVYGGLTGNKVKLTTDEKGSAADVDYVSSTGDFGVQSGFGAGPTAGVNAGPNEVARHSNVTSAELAPLAEAAWTSGGGVVATVTGDSWTVETVSEGGTASIGAVTGSGMDMINNPIVFTEVGLVTGTDAGDPGVATIEVIATSEGDHGNNLAVTTQRVTTVVAKLTADMLAADAPFDFMEVDVKSQLRVGLQVYIQDPVNVAYCRGVVSRIIGSKIYFENPVTPSGDLEVANVSTVKKETFNLSVIIDGNTSKVTRYVDMSMSPLDKKYFANMIGTNPELMDPMLRIYVANEAVAYTNTVDPRPVDVTLQALTGGLDGDAITNTDLIGLAANHTGLHAFDTNLEFSLSGIPGYDNAEVHKALVEYAETRKDHVTVLDAPVGYTPAQVVTYKNVTAGLFSTYAILQAGRIRVRRASTDQIETFPNIGYVLGLFARNDRDRNVSEAPSGDSKGRLKGVYDIYNNNEYSDINKRNIIYPEGINCIYASHVGAIYFGQNLTDNLGEINAVGVRRAFLYISKVITQLSQFVLWEKNTLQLRLNFVNVIEAFLNQQWQKDVLSGDSADQAYLVECNSKNNPPALIEAKGFYAKVSIHVLPGIENGLIELQTLNGSLINEG